MASLLFIILAIFFIAVIILLSLGTYVLSALFGGFMNLKNFVCRLLGWGSSNNAQANSSQSSSSRTSSKATSGSAKSKKHSSASQEKMFGQDEGTYIDFEEVK